MSIWDISRAHGKVLPQEAKKPTRIREIIRDTHLRWGVEFITAACSFHLSC